MMRHRSVGSAKSCSVVAGRRIASLTDSRHPTRAIICVIWWLREPASALASTTCRSTGGGLLLQHEHGCTGFILVALAQGAVYLLAVGVTWRGGFSRRALVAMLGL